MTNETFEQELNKLREMGPSTFVLRGSTLLVEILPKEEIKTKSGIVLHSDSQQLKGHTAAAHSVDTAIVRIAGEGYWDEETKQMLPLDCQPGAIILLPQYSAQLMSHFPGISKPTSNKLAMVKMDQVLAYYPSVEAYNKAKELINN